MIAPTRRECGCARDRAQRLLPRLRWFDSTVCHEQPNATTASKRCRQHVFEIIMAFVLRYGGSLEGGLLLPPDLHVPLR